SQSLPIKRRANTVPVTAKIMESHFCCGVRPRSLTTSGINGTIPNQAKKQIKKAMEVIQKVRMGMLLISVSFKRVAFLDGTIILGVFCVIWHSKLNIFIRINTYYRNRMKIWTLFYENAGWRRVNFVGFTIIIRNYFYIINII